MMFLLLFFLHLVRSNTLCNTVDNKASYRYEEGKEQPICFLATHALQSYLNTTYKWENYCACINVKVDEFTLIQLQNTDDSTGETDEASNPFQFLSSNVKADTSHLFIEAGGKSNSEGMLLRYIEGTTRYYAGVQTIVIELEKGKVKDIVWDNVCDSSECSACIANENGKATMCGFHKSDCASQRKCEIKVYVSWFGTDKNDVYLTSAGMRLSRFKGTSATSALDSAIKAGSKVEFSEPDFDPQSGSYNSGVSSGN